LSNKERTALIPRPDDAPEVRQKFHEMLGVPKDIAGYGVTKPADWPTELAWNQESLDGYLKIMHENGIPPEAAKALVNAKIAEDTANYKALKDWEAESETKELQALKDDWKGGFEANLAKAQRGAAMMGVPKDSPLRSSAEFIQYAAKVADMVSETKMPDGAPDLGAKSDYDEAMSIMNDPTNKYYKLYYEGDTTVAARVTAMLKSGKK